MDQRQSDNHILNNRYKLLERVGSGGMAAVYKAQDLVLGRAVAVKVLHAGLMGEEDFRDRFQQEAHSAARLAHPNIVTVHDVGQDGDRFYIVMEYVEGPTLKQVVRDQAAAKRPMSINRALDLTIQICAGIGYAHRSDLVHCDVKPHNMLLTLDERVKVTDFGIARAISAATVQGSSTVWGTPQYFAPEQASGHAPTPASDVYAIGVILFELLTGRLPFEAESHTGYALKHMREAPPYASEINPNVPPQLDKIVAKVLSKDPLARYRTAGQFGRILSTYRRHSAEEITQPPQPTVPSTEQETQIYRRPLPQQPPPVITPVVEPEPEPATVYGNPLDHARQPIASPTDWIAVTLAVIAFVLLVGLIPLWYAVFLRFAV